MSACISSHGEYSAHEPDDEFVCTLCGVLDEESLRAELRRLRSIPPMAARETTLGALTAADLGKRAALPQAWGGTMRGVLCRIDHKAAIDGGAETFVGVAMSAEEPDLQRGGIRLPSDTPVTVYDEEADDDR